MAGLPTRTFAIRDQQIPPADTGGGGGGVGGGGGGGGGGGSEPPGFDLSVNFVPVTYPAYEPARIAMPPGAAELWRVINAGADTILDLQVGKHGPARQDGIASQRFRLTVL